MDLQFAQSLITKHEGFRSMCYRDSRGFLTVGIGFNLDDASAQASCTALGLDYQGLRSGQPISLIQAQALLNRKIDSALTAAQFIFPAWDQIKDNAQAVVIDMIYNLGAAGFSKFQLMITALRCFDYPEAAVQMKNSLWYTQVGLRGIEDVSLMEAA